jgi:hypothetical protein
MMQQGRIFGHVPNINFLGRSSMLGDFMAVLPFRVSQHNASAE